MRTWVPSLAVLSGMRIWCCCELWCRPAGAAPLGPLAWELPCAACSPKKQKQQKYPEQ